MDRGTWQATIHEVTRVRHDLLTKPPQIMKQDYLYHNYKITVNLNGVSRVCVHVKSFQLCLTLCNSMNYITCQTPLSMELSRLEYLSGLPCPLPGDLPDPGIGTASPETPKLLVDSLPLSHQGRPRYSYSQIQNLEGFHVYVYKRTKRENK